MAKAKKPAGAAKASNTLDVKAKDGEDHDKLLARVALGPAARHASIGSNYAASLFSDGHQTPIMASTAVIGEAMAKARTGDKAMPSDILAAQAVVLDTMFTELARRSAANMGEYPWMTAPGSLPEWQEFFRGEAKPQDRFQDRASAPLMAGRGR